MPINGPLIKEKALKLADQFNLHDFIASNGRLEKFTKRYSISFKALSGEAADVNAETCVEWKKRLPELINLKQKKIMNI